MSGPDQDDPKPDDNVYSIKGDKISNLLPEEITNDLKKSGLHPEDMRIRMVDPSEKAACNCGMATRGYVIPYFDSKGQPTDFYRLKVLNPEVENGAKYKQPRRTSNQLYFPPNFLPTLVSWCTDHATHKLLIITEGEKKAACATSVGIPCVALSGVDSWRNKTIELPSDTELTAGKKTIKAKLPSSHLANTDMLTLATGFEDLIGLIIQHGLKVVIIFDSDIDGDLKLEVQKAATQLAYELRYRGVRTDSIKLLKLPSHSVATGAKTGLDDYIMWAAAYNLTKLLLKVYDDISAFPRHPDIMGYLNTRLNNSTDRKTLVQVAHVILCELDARGMRFRERSTGKPYYFHRESNRLMAAEIATRHGEPWHETAFGTFMYQQFGLHIGDKRVMEPLASQFTGESPITTVTPHRVRALITEHEDPYNPHGIAIQVSNDHYIAVSPDPSKPVELCENGKKGIMFEQRDKPIPFPLDYDRVVDLFYEMIGEGAVLKPWWLEVVNKTNLGRILEPSDLCEEDKGEQQQQKKQPTQSEADQMRRLFTLLRYVSPWLHRWRDVQLPIEIMLGEAGSGKTSLYELALSIVNGDPNLPGAPRDIRDWQAIVGSSGGLIVFDNVNWSNQHIKQEISDDMCRLTTEPDPHIEQRKLYTDSTVIRIPVDANLAFTSIRQPFRNQDLFQRAVIFELVIAAENLPEGGWAKSMLEEYGGREYWMAHHLVFLHRFLRIGATEQGWDPKFPTTNRLAHLEQVLKIAAEVLGLTDTKVPIGKTIQLTQAKAFTDADWTFSALQKWIDHIRSEQNYNPRKRHRVNEIVDWAEEDEEISKNPMMVSSHKLGRWLSDNHAMLERSVGLKYSGIQGNAKTYQVWSRAMMEFDASDLKKEIDGRPQKDS
jgi:hypothetical protein